ncbi:9230_t:CDS:2 [Entrophospora sp. SA101]|nr:9230_t:CDS:2 [Entrophospora sp. SA101]
MLSRKQVFLKIHHSSLTLTSQKASKTDANLGNWVESSNSRSRTI